MVVPFSNVSFLRAVMATMATLRLTRSAYTLKKPKKARTATTRRLLFQNFQDGPNPSSNILGSVIFSFSLVSIEKLKQKHITRKCKGTGLFVEASVTYLQTHNLHWAQHCDICNNTGRSVSYRSLVS